MNDDTGLIAAIVLKMKLAAGAGYFLDRPRPRLTGAVGTIESIVVGSVCSEVGSTGGSTGGSIGGSTDGLIDGSIDDSADGGCNSSLV
jgi:hypothetical protein